MTVLARCQFDGRVCGMDEAGALRDRQGPPVAADPEFDDSVLRITRMLEPYGLAVSGEIDAARHTAVTRALAALDGLGEREPNEIHLDLTGLRFIDLGGLGLIAEHAVRHARRHTIVLDHVPTQLRTVMEIVGWQALPGLRIGEPGEVEVG